MILPAPGRSETPSPPKLPYVAGIDGLRAIAVIAVLLYHGQDLTGLPSIFEPQAGFLGVEVFFVISGYLITSLLLDEHARDSTIDLKNFWMRRARRLLPALFTFLLGTSVLAGLFASDAFDKIRQEILGAIFYVSNWLLIATDESYFEAAGRPSLLRHLWSLAIEEQFYLLWPIVLLFGLRRFGKRVMLGGTVLAIGASTTLMWLLFDRVEQYGDVTSIYYRTDARASALLIGAAGAFLWRPWARPEGAKRPGPGQRHLIDGAGLAALAAVVWLQYAFTDRVIEWHLYERLYQGGFLLLSLLTMLVIAAVVSPGSLLGWALGNPIMRWIGMRSYGLYLWHWPVFQLTRPRVDVDVDGWTLFALRLAITLALTELSYRLVEMPIRERRFVTPLTEAVRTPRGVTIGTVGALAMILATASIAVAVPTIEHGTSSGTRIEVAASGDGSRGLAPAVGASSRSSSGSGPVAEETPTPTPAPQPSPDPSDPPPAPTAGEPTPAPGVTRAGGDQRLAEVGPPLPEPTRVEAGGVQPPQLVTIPSPTATPTLAPLPPPPPLSAPFDIAASRIHVVGDSVVLGAAGQLARISDTVTIDGRVGRQWWELEGELRQMRAQGLAGDVVIIQLGNNGSMSTQMFQGVMNALAGTRLVLFINIRAPVVWEAEMNGLLTHLVNQYPQQARLIDWYSASNQHPEYFIEDGTHLSGSGQSALRWLIESALLQLS